VRIALETTLIANVQFACMLEKLREDRSKCNVGTYIAHSEVNAGADDDDGSVMAADDSNIDWCGRKQ